MRALTGLRITIEDCDENDAGDLMAHLEEIGLLATYEIRTPRSRTGWAPFIPEHEEERGGQDR